MDFSPVTAKLPCLVVSGCFRSWPQAYKKSILENHVGWLIFVFSDWLMLIISSIKFGIRHLVFFSNLCLISVEFVAGFAVYLFTMTTVVDMNYSSFLLIKEWRIFPQVVLVFPPRVTGSRGNPILHKVAERWTQSWSGKIMMAKAY